MAEATITKRHVDINLTLSEEEAITLCALTAFIGGDPSNTRRSHTDSIGNALHNSLVEAGLYHRVNSARAEVTRETRGIRFDKMNP